MGYPCIRGIEGQEETGRAGTRMKGEKSSVNPLQRNQREKGIAQNKIKIEQRLIDEAESVRCAPMQFAHDDVIWGKKVDKKNIIFIIFN